MVVIQKRVSGEAGRVGCCGMLLTEVVSVMWLGFNMLDFLMLSLSLLLLLLMKLPYKGN